MRTEHQPLAVYTQRQNLAADRSQLRLVVSLKVSCPQRAAGLRVRAPRFGYSTRAAPFLCWVEPHTVQRALGTGFHPPAATRGTKPHAQEWTLPSASSQVLTHVVSTEYTRTAHCAHEESTSEKRSCSEGCR